MSQRLKFASEGSISRSSGRLNTVISLIALTVFTGAAFAGTGRTGVQLIGLEAVDHNDINTVAQIFANCPANKACELHELAYSFVQGSVADVHDSVTSFKNAEALVKAVLPTLNKGQVFVLTVSLEDGPNRNSHYTWTSFSNNLTNQQFWGKVSSNDSAFKAKWQQVMVAPYAQFAQRIQAWASANKYSNRLRLIVVPVLEDHATSTKAYQTLANWTQQALPSGVSMRRNGSGRLSGLTLELHTSGASFSLQADDAVSNDGVTVDGARWQAMQTQALKQNAAALLWRTEFNANSPADRNSKAPYQRGTLKPFAQSSQVTSLVAWITYRPNGL
jgi:hypothetical protein